MSRTSSIQLCPPYSRVLEARVALERLHVVLDRVTDTSIIDLVHAARTLWLSVVFDLAELQEESPRWPSVDDIDLDRVARRAANRYDAFVAPLIDFDSATVHAQLDIRDAIGRVIDALDVYVDSERGEKAAAG